MRSPSLSELRRLFRHALLAAPLALVACPEPAPILPTSGDGGTAATATATTETPPAKKCDAERPNITGCGGAEVALHDSLASCGLPADGEIPADRCKELCAGFDTRSCRVYKNREGRPGVFCDAAHPCLGRPAAGDAAEPASGEGVKEYLALARRMEARSVCAFRELEADLARWGAPARLLRACRRAADDEARHARATATLLRRRGGRPEPLRRAPARHFPSLFALALHNERHGVVGETWGALVAAHQAKNAAEQDIGDAMGVIAREEAEHAALSIQLARWARQRLTREEARWLDEERHAAFGELRTTLGFRPPAATARALGWPTPAKSAAMLEALAPVLG